MDYESNKINIKKYYKEHNIFSNDQLKAVIAPYTGEKNILLSAGAGCGKTFVLSKRVVYLLETTSLSINNFLILTFTNNASAEMKQRIKKEIKDEITYRAEREYVNDDIVEKLEKELIKVDSSSISTFDSFANKLVSMNISRLGIKPGFSVVDESVIDYERNKITDKILFEEFNNPNSKITKLYFDRKEEKNFTNLKSILNEIQLQKNKLPNADEYFANLKENGYVTDKNLFNAYYDIFISTMEKIDVEFDKLKEINNSGILNCPKRNILDETIKEYNFRKNLLETKIKNKSLKSFSDITNEIKAFWGCPTSFSSYKANCTSNFTNQPESKEYTYTNLFDTKDINDEALKKDRTYLKNIFDGAKKKLVEYIKQLFSFPTVESLKTILNKNKELLDYLIELSYSIDKELTEFKNNISGYTFNDIVNFSLKLLHEYKDVRVQIRDNYKAIMVDEYQDSNNLQEELLKILGTDEENYLRNNFYKTGNIFMVGDIKQSIYRFRNAVPELFQNKINNSDEFNTEVITMNKNFRSNENVIDQVNDIFGLVMTNNFGGIDYKQTKNPQELDKSNPNLYEDELKDIPTYIFDYNENKDNEQIKKLGSVESCKTLIQANLIAKTIKEAITNNVKLPNKKNNKISYSSFAILFRNTTHIDEYIKALNSLNIPYNLEVDEKLSNNNSYIALKHLLIIENFVLKEKEENVKLTQEEIDRYNFSMVSVKRSFILNMYDDEIYEEKKNNQNSLKDKLIAINEKYGFNIDSPIYEIFNILVKEFEIYSKLSTLANCDQEYQAYILFSNQIYSFYNFGFSLDEVCSQLNYVTDKGLDTKTKVYRTNSDAVTLTTIHKSKGLAYDFVILGDIDAKLTNTNKISKSIYFSDKYGVFLDYFEHDRESLYDDYTNVQNIETIYDLNKKINMYVSNDDGSINESKLQEFYKLYVKNKLLNVLKELYIDTEKKESLSEEVRLLYVAFTRARYKVLFTYFSNDLFDTEKDSLPKPIAINTYSEMIRLDNSKYKHLFKNLKVEDIPIKELSKLLYVPTDEIDFSDFNNDNQNINFINVEPIDFNIFQEKQIGKRASKDKIEFIDNSKAINKGLQMHSLLESINYENYPNVDLSYIEDSRNKKLISNFLSFLSNILIENKINNPSIYQEFNFFDIQENRVGSMDLYIDSKDKGIIIDYKLKHIDDEAYTNQLNTYRRNASSIFNHNEKDIKCYLYSIYDSDYKEI